ncbi:15474_t:CDS:2, partial [Acaulospora morrowiae]
MSLFLFGIRDGDSTTIDPVDPFSGDPIFDDALGLSSFRRNSDRDWNTPRKNDFAVPNFKFTEKNADIDIRGLNNGTVVHVEPPSNSSVNVNGKDDMDDTATGYIHESRSM